MIRKLGVFLAAALALWADGPGTLQIQVLDGADAVYPLGSRATRGVTVLVRDEAGRPVEGATVSFSLPAQGPGGVFASGARTEIVQTASDGRAAAWGMRWNRSPGEFALRVTAMKGQARASTSVAQLLSAAEELRLSAPKGSGGHKLLWIALAGGAAAAVAGVAGRGSPSSGSSTTAPATLSGVQIGSPSIVVGRP